MLLQLSHTINVITVYKGFIIQTDEKAY